MEHWRNVLLIAGTGRNSGKTTLAVKIIEGIAPLHDLYAVKISPHFHRGTSGLRPVHTSAHFNLYEEQGGDPGKDSARMVLAGAGKVYYVEVEDPHLEAAFKALSGLFPREAPVVIESPALRKVMTPGVYFIVDHPHCKEKKSEVLLSAKEAHAFINTDRADLDGVVGKLQFRKGSWSYFP